MQSISYKAKVLTKDKISFSISAIADNNCDPIRDDFLPTFEENLLEKILQVENYILASAQLSLWDGSGKTLIKFQRTLHNPKPGI